MAVAQITAQGASAVRQMPPGTTPPFILVYNASSVPILQLALSGKGLSEQQLFDFAVNNIRTSLATVQGAAIPYPYGGKQRQVMIDIRPDLLQAKGLSPADVVNAVSAQNLILPSGTSKIGQFEYDVDLNSSPTRCRNSTICRSRPSTTRRFTSTTWQMYATVIRRRPTLCCATAQRGVLTDDPESRPDLHAGNCEAGARRACRRLRRRSRRS